MEFLNDKGNVWIKVLKSSYNIERTGKMTNADNCNQLGNGGFRLTNTKLSPRWILLQIFIIIRKVAKSSSPCIIG